MSNSIYWYDLETFGIDPKLDRVAQFAGIRTDESLNIISDPLIMYCRPADDMLPDPQSCLITGITPQKAKAEGVCEAEFIASIHREFSHHGTCIAGFNNLRFDDEFVRNLCYRNFYNPYAHEWQNGNSRWDIIDMVRMTRALRPEGIEWPYDEGRPTNRLERITQENGIAHEAAHDAMSDVYATIEVARLIREKQPRLFDYLYQLRRKNKVSELIDLRTHGMFLHASSKYPVDRGAIALVMPICVHPVNKNGIIVYDLSVRPDELIEIDADEIAGRLFTPRDELPEGVERIPLKTIHMNKCPAIAPVTTMDAEAAARLSINRDIAETNRERLLEEIQNIIPKLNTVFSQQDYPMSPDPETQLYSGGFFNPSDSQQIERVRRCPPHELTTCHPSFDDQRLPELLFRYKARNFPDTLSETERLEWSEWRKNKLTDPEYTPRTLNQLEARIEELRLGEFITGDQLAVLDELDRYITDIRKSL